MTENSPELVKWKNHARELQIAEILKGASNDVKVEIDLNFDVNPDQFSRFADLMETPPILLPTVLERFQETEEDFYSKAAEVLKLSAKYALIAGVLAALAQVCNETASKPRRIAVDSIALEKTSLIEAAFKNHSEKAALALGGGRDEAIVEILKYTEDKKKTPLMRYKRDWVEKRLQPDPTQAGCSFFCLPTKIDGVDLRLLYLESEQVPQLSFEVRSLE